MSDEPGSPVTEEPVWPESVTAAPPDVQRATELDRRRGGVEQAIAEHDEQAELLEAFRELLAVVDDIATEQCEAGENVEYWNRTTGHGYRVVARARAALARTEA